MQKARIPRRGASDTERSLLPGIRRSPSRPHWQAKLKVGNPSDAMEREADDVAEAVMRMTEPSVPGRSPGARGCGGCSIARQVEPGPAAGEEEEAAAIPDTPENACELEEANVHPKRDAATATRTFGSALRAALRHGGGQPMGRETRAFMEPRFGHDFSRVRIHTGARAHRAARSIGARAFTVGQDIWFARGHYAPASHAGRRLLAHELAHTLQQGTGEGTGVVQRSICPGPCRRPVSAGNICRTSRVTHDDCAQGNEADPKHRISHIRVLLDARQVHLFWNGRPGTSRGTKRVHPGITPNASSTPRGWDRIGLKCTVNHTNWKGARMAWFTGFRSTGYRIGFHDSQPLGWGRRSAGCVRTSCELARTIRQNTRSNWTSIIVRNRAPGD